jgi:hypothetical protein
MKLLLHIYQLQLGLTPSWAKDSKKTPQRNQTVNEKPALTTARITDA